MKKNKKKIKRKEGQNHKKIKMGFLFIVILFVLALSPVFVKADRTLEITYPTIPGAITPTTISSGLPDYVNYIFHFSVVIIGFIIFGVLIYSGVQYLTSAGSPEKLTDAKKGIFYAFLGAIILLSSYLIFNTINPQLTLLKLENPKTIEPVVTPGIYLCNYNVPGIDGIINNYKSGDESAVIAAAKQLKNIMKNGDKKCFRVKSSGNLDSFIFDNHRDTFFIIPKKIYKTEGGIDWEYDFGIIFHEKDNFHGRCNLVANVYNSHTPTMGSSLDTSRSVTIFQKATLEPSGENKGVILYTCLNYGDLTLCPGATRGPSEGFGGEPSGGGGAGGGFGGTAATSTLEWSYKPSSGSPLEVVSASTPGGGGNVLKKARSIKIDPENFYFAVLSSGDNLTGDKCNVFHNNTPNILNQPIGRCGSSCHWLSWLLPDKWETDHCFPCQKSMVVIKGEVL